MENSRNKMWLSTFWPQTSLRNAQMMSMDHRSLMKDFSSSSFPSLTQILLAWRQTSVWMRGKHCSPGLYSKHNYPHMKTSSDEKETVDPVIHHSQALSKQIWVTKWYTHDSLSNWYNRVLKREKRRDEQSGWTAVVSRADRWGEEQDAEARCWPTVWCSLGITTQSPESTTVWLLRQQDTQRASLSATLAQWRFSGWILLGKTPGNYGVQTWGNARCAVHRTDADTASCAFSRLCGRAGRAVN